MTEGWKAEYPAYEMAWELTRYQLRGELEGWLKGVQDAVSEAIKRATSPTMFSMSANDAIQYLRETWGDTSSVDDSIDFHFEYVHRVENLIIDQNELAGFDYDDMREEAHYQFLKEYIKEVMP